MYDTFLSSQQYRNNGWMKVFLGHFFGTIKAELGRGQPGLMR